MMWIICDDCGLRYVDDMSGIHFCEGLIENCKPIEKKRVDSKDNVNHPTHYTAGNIECIEYLEDQFMNRPHEWNAVKYLTRSNQKGKEIEDLEKAIWYIRRKLSLLKKENIRPNEMLEERE